MRRPPSSRLSGATGLAPARITRRTLGFALATLLALGAAPVWAAGPKTSPVPEPRPAYEPPSAASLVAQNPISGVTGYILVDAESGEVLEQRLSDKAFLPASVAKAPTALYAYQVLGPDYVFSTSLLVAGPVENGVLKGDLYLQGGGDPELDTDKIAELAGALKAAGIVTVEGGFYVAHGGLPAVPQIDPTQPGHVAYNPSVGGLNLNFNRVLMEWRRTGKAEYEVDLEARALKWSPKVAMMRPEIGEMAQQGSVFEHEVTPKGEVWRVAREALGPEGSRWLPVRDSALYAGAVLREVAHVSGVILPEPQHGETPVLAQRIATVQSRPTSVVLTKMLKYSTNLSAEVVGMSATAARGAPSGMLNGSAAAMTRWLGETLQIDVTSGLALENHSGLSSRSRVTPEVMAQILVGAMRLPGPPVGDPKVVELRGGVGGALWRLMPDYRLREGEGEPALPPIEIRAKSGTMYYGRGLAGYMKGEDGRPLVFAIFTSDFSKRARLDALPNPEARERPRGGRGWLRRAQYLERAILKSWARQYSVSESDAGNARKTSVKTSAAGNG